MATSTEKPKRSQEPVVERDGTVCVLLDEPVRPLAYGYMLSLRVPTSIAEQTHLGHYFMVRCAPAGRPARYHDWSIYKRLPLSVTDISIRNPRNEQFSRLDLFFAHTDHLSSDWLLSLQPASALNVIGPLGKAVEIPAPVRTLLLVAPYARVPALLPAVHCVLDRGGRVTLLVVESGRDNEILRHLPLAVEVQELLSLTGDRERLLAGVRWADAMFFSVHQSQYGYVRDIIAQARFRLEPNFAYVLTAADLLCGFGACLACVVPTLSGRFTRACVHGPLIDFSELAS